MIDLSSLTQERIDEMIEIANYNFWNTDELDDLQPSMEVAGIECDDEDISDCATRYALKFNDVFLPNSLGLYIFGDNGTGKTYLAKLIYKLINIKTDNTTLFILSDDAVKLYDENPKFRDLIKRTDLLVLDNLSIPKTPYQIRKLEALINARYDSGKPLIVTTTIHRADLNTTDCDLKNIFDKLIEMTHPVLIDHLPRRKEIARERKDAIDKLLRLS